MNYELALPKFTQEINQPEEDIDLAKAALYWAMTEYPHLDPEIYLKTLDTMGEELRQQLPKNFYPLKIIQSINNYMFEQLKFRGNSQNYYDPSNSFLNQVIERRTGIPITLSLVYLELASRIDFPMVGIGMPGHFLIRPSFEEAGIFIDVFNGGELMFELDCEEKLQQIYQKPIKLESAFLPVVSKKQLLVRMLTNLKFIYINSNSILKALSTVEFILSVFPDNAQELRDRGLIYYHLGELDKSAQDLELYLTMVPNASDSSLIISLLAKMR